MVFKKNVPEVLLDELRISMISQRWRQAASGHLGMLLFHEMSNWIFLLLGCSFGCRFQGKYLSGKS
jgi:hypothetical protein